MTPFPGQQILRPKQLFPSRNAGDSFDTDPNSVAFSAYEYQSPMEKHLTAVLTEISEKEIEIEKIKSDIESMKPTDYSNGDTSGYNLWEVSPREPHIEEMC